MKRLLTTLILLTALTNLLSAQNAYARYLSNNITYKNISSYEGNVDYIQSTHAGIFVEAYRRMNGLGMPKNTDYARWHKNNYYSLEKDWKNKISTILGIEKKFVRIQYGRNIEFASKVLDERINTLGISHPYIKNWLENQNLILTHISRNNTNFIPNPYETNEHDTPELKHFKKYDYQYQLASSYFYSAKFDTALLEYKKVAGNKNSPYYATAHYMIARTLLSEHKYDEAYNQLQSILKNQSLQSVHNLSSGLIGTLASRSGNAIYEAEQLQQILKPLLKKINTSDDEQYLEQNFRTLNNDLWFYLSFNGTKLAGVQKLAKENDLLDWLLTFTGAGMYIHNTHWTDKMTNHDCSGPRIRCDNDTLQHAIHKWNETKKLHWLIPVIMRLPYGHDLQDEAITTFRKLDNKIKNNTANTAELVAYPTIVHHAVRLLVNDKKYDEVDNIIYPALEFQKEYAPRIAFNTAKFLISIGELKRAEKLVDTVIKQDGFLDVNGFYDLKIILTDDLNDFVYLGEEIYKKQNHYWHSPYNNPNFIQAVAETLNLMPVSVLVQLSKDKKLSMPSRIELKLVALVRSMLLKNYDTANELAMEINTEVPELSQYLQPFINAGSDEEKHRAALYLFLKNPRLKPYLHTGNYKFNPDWRNKGKLSKFEIIDTYNRNDNNWWCGFDYQDRRKRAEHKLFDRIILPSPITWHGHYNRKSLWYGRSAMIDNALVSKNKNDFFANSSIFRLIDLGELKELELVGNATRYLPSETIKWFNESSIFEQYSNDKLPEALSRSVKLARYGCNKDKNKGKYSKQAFSIVHKKYWFSDWKNKTPYWFK